MSTQNNNAINLTTNTPIKNVFPNFYIILIISVGIVFLVFIILISLFLIYYSPPNSNVDIKTLCKVFDPALELSSTSGSLLEYYNLRISDNGLVSSYCDNTNIYYSSRANIDDEFTYRYLLCPGTTAFNSSKSTMCMSLDGTIIIGGVFGTSQAFYNILINGQWNTIPLPYLTGPNVTFPFYSCAISPNNNIICYSFTYSKNLTGDVIILNYIGTTLTLNNAYIFPNTNSIGTICSNEDGTIISVALTQNNQTSIAILLYNNGKWQSSVITPINTININSTMKIITIKEINQIMLFLINTLTGALEGYSVNLSNGALTLYTRLILPTPTNKNFGDFDFNTTPCLQWLYYGNYQENNSFGVIYVYYFNGVSFIPYTTFSPAIAAINFGQGVAVSSNGQYMITSGTSTSINLYSYVNNLLDK